MEKVDLSRFDKKPKKRERISKAVMEQPADSEIAQYLTERARVDAMCPNVPVCIVLDGTAIIKTDTIFEDIIDAFRYAPKESSQIVIPLQVIEDITEPDISAKIASHQRHLTFERADLSLLPKECQATNSINMTLAVAAKNAAMKKICLLISDNAAMRLIAGALGIKATGTDEFAYKLSSFKQYWTNRRNIALGKVTDNLDWGTILPLKLYSEMSREEYENYGYLMVEDGEEVVPEGHTGGFVQHLQDHTMQEANTPTVDDWVRKNFHPRNKWDWVGLVFILFNSGLLGSEFNASAIERALKERYPDIINKVNLPPHLNSCRTMIYCKIIKDWEIANEAERIWYTTGEDTRKMDKNFSGSATKSSFMVIKTVFPLFANEFRDILTWKY